MHLSKLEIKNFRLLKNISISIEQGSTVIVGRNNSGKTSLTEIFRRLINDTNPKFLIEDFSLSSILGFQKAFERKVGGEKDESIRAEIPTIEIALTIQYDPTTKELGSLGDFIIDLDDKSSVAVINIKYQLNDGRINALFDGITGKNDPTFYVKVGERIPNLFSTTIYAVDPTNPTNTRTIELSKFKNLLCVGFINAQRGLDDITHKEKDVLGKILAKLFKTSGNESAPADMKAQSEALENIVKEIQGIIDGRFNDSASKLLPALKLFGYPGLSDPKISTETTLKTDNILDQHTRIKYNIAEGISLPETYNGLGSRNLIYILFQLFEFFRDYQSRPITPGIYLVFIEEPEAHLHPQMQEVFIRQISNIARKFSEEFNSGKQWPSQFVVTTHSTHIANEASFDSVRYFMTARSGENIETKIKDLRLEFSSTGIEVDKEFLHKYLTLTKCDLFFADKAILIEGTCERILMPKFIEKVDAELGTSLASQFISSVEIGGSHAHHFFKFLDFLELSTLIITDIDSAKSTKSDKSEQVVYPKWLVCESTHSRNTSINAWFKKPGDEAGYLDINDVMKKTIAEKTIGKRHLSYQIPEVDKGACGRSFEEAFILANTSHFSVATGDNKSVETDIEKKAREIGKTDFALEYAIDKNDWSVPKYIKDGLVWLAKLPIETTIVEVAPATKTKKKRDKVRA